MAHRLPAAKCPSLSGSRQFPSMIKLRTVARQSAESETMCMGAKFRPFGCMKKTHLRMRPAGAGAADDGAVAAAQRGGEVLPLEEAEPTATAASRT